MKKSKFISVFCSKSLSGKREVYCSFALRRQPRSLDLISKNEWCNASSECMQKPPQTLHRKVRVCSANFSSSDCGVFKEFVHTRTHQKNQRYFGLDHVQQSQHRKNFESVTKVKWWKSIECSHQTVVHIFSPKGCHRSADISHKSTYGGCITAYLCT